MVEIQASIMQKCVFIVYYSDVLASPMLKNMCSGVYLGLLYIQLRSDFVFCFRQSLNKIKSAAAYCILPLKCILCIENAPFKGKYAVHSVIGGAMQYCFLFRRKVAGETNKHATIHALRIWRIQSIRRLI